MKAPSKIVRKTKRKIQPIQLALQYFYLDYELVSHVIYVKCTNFVYE